MFSTLFSVYYAAALVVLSAELLFRRRTTPARKPARSALPYVVLLVVSYACELFVIRYAAVEQTDWALWRWFLPLPVVTRTANHAELVALAIIALTALQSWLLWAVYRAKISRGATVAGCAVLAVLSFCEPALISPDVYSYVADALLRGAAYAPPSAPFSGAYRVINDALGVPLPAAPYGPLWIWLARAALALPSLLAELMAFRVIGIVSFAAMLAAFARLHLSARVLAIAALNPGLMLQYVTNAHNEIVCMACIAWAAVAVRRAPWVSAALLVAAALVKLPFAVLGAPIFIHLRNPPARWAWAAVVSLVSFALSWLFGGSAYIRELVRHLPGGGAADVLGLCVAAASIGLLAAALVTHKRLHAAVWCFPLTGSYPTPWYAGWGLGYALTSRSAIAYLLIWFPLCSALVDTMFMQLWTIRIAVPLLSLACVVAMAVRAARRA